MKHQLKIITKDRITKRLISEEVEEFFSIYNLRRRKFEVEDKAVEDKFIIVETQEKEVE